MDAVEFLNQLNRRYKSNPKHYPNKLYINNIEPFSFVEQIENWAKENPAKTRQSEFLKHYSNAPISKNDGYPAVSPCFIETKFYKFYNERYENSNCEGNDCRECRKKYWTQEVE